MATDSSNGGIMIKPGVQCSAGTPSESGLEFSHLRPAGRGRTASVRLRMTQLLMPRSCRREEVLYFDVNTPLITQPTPGSCSPTISPMTNDVSAWLRKRL